MKINKLYLKNYNRLSLKKINELTLEPISKIHLILGPNGSGKSSIMDELTPLSGSPKDYQNEKDKLIDGVKLLEVEHRGKNYTLINEFSKVSRYIFLCEGEEIYRGNVASVYNEYVRKHFNLNNNVHQLLMNNRKFTLLTPSDRRNYIMELSTLNYEPAVNYYNKLKNEHRDLVGGLKLLNQRLIIEKSKCLSGDTLESLNKRKSDLEKDLNSYLNIKNNNVCKKLSNSSIVRDEIESLLDRLNNMMPYLNNKGNPGIEELSLILDRQAIKLKEEQTLVSKLGNDIVNQHELINKLKTINGSNKEECLKEIKNIEEEKYKACRFLTLGLNIKNPELAYNSFNAVHYSIVDLIDNIDDIYFNESNIFGRDSIQSHINKNEENLLSLKSFYEDYKSKYDEMEHLKNKSEITCPNCNHKWFDKFDENIYNDIKQKLNSTIERAKELKKLREDYNKKKSTIENNIKIINTIKSLFRSNDELFFLFEYKLDVKNKSELMGFYNNVKRELEILTEINKHEENITKLNANLGLLESSSLVSLEDAIKLKEKLLECYNGSLNKVTFYKSEIEEVKNIISVRKQLNILTETLFKTLETKDENLKSDIDYLINEHILNGIRNTSVEIEDIRKNITAIENHKNVLRDLDIQIKEYSEEIDIYDKVLKELSPTTGLIATSLKNFINKFIDDVNSVIAMLWCYPLKIKVAENTSEENKLDFKFPVVVGDREISDILLGSTAIKEVIDLSVRLTSMKYLKITDYPVFLDEFASSYDILHRDAAVSFIKKLSELTDIGQIFIISHYKEIYGSFTNSGITDLN